MIRFGSTAVALLDGSRDVGADRASQLAIRVLPGQAILLARGADDALRILVHVVDRTLLQRIFVLSFHVAAAYVNGVEFDWRRCGGTGVPGVRPCCRNAICRLSVPAGQGNGRRRGQPGRKLPRPVFGSTETIFRVRSRATKSGSVLAVRAASPLSTMSMPWVPKIAVRAAISKLAAASISTSAAFCGESNVLAGAAAAAAFSEPGSVRFAAAPAVRST